MAKQLKDKIEKIINKKDTAKDIIIDLLLTLFEEDRQSELRLCWEDAQDTYKKSIREKIEKLHRYGYMADCFLIEDVIKIIEEE